MLIFSPKGQSLDCRMSEFWKMSLVCLGVIRVCSMAIGSRRIHMLRSFHTRHSAQYN